MMLTYLLGNWGGIREILWDHTVAPDPEGPWKL